jgi:hypothetical protein
MLVISFKLVQGRVTFRLINTKSLRRFHRRLFVCETLSWPDFYLITVRKASHAARLKGSSGLSLVLESRTRTRPVAWPTSTHAPPLPPLRLDLRH